MLETIKRNLYYLERELAATNIRNEQKRTKEHYDNKSIMKPHPNKIGDWVLVCFPQEETGKKLKLMTWAI